MAYGSHVWSSIGSKVNFGISNISDFSVPDEGYSRNVSCKLNLWPSWPWSYRSWIYNYQCNRCLSPLMLSVRIPLRERCTALCDKVCQWLATGRWFSPCPPVSSTNKTDRHDITEILLNVALNTIKPTKLNLISTFL
jgi:hypothetical protein